MPPTPRSIRFASQLVEPSSKRQRMSSDTSESTLAIDAPPAEVLDPGACWVASEDLSSMVFQTAHLQRITDSWASYVPLVYGETLMKRDLKECQDTVNSLRNTLESLEIKAARTSHSDTGDVTDNSYATPEDQEARAAKEAKSVLSVTNYKIQALTT